MISNLIENVLQVTTAESATEVICYAIVTIFVFAVVFSKLNKFPAFINYTPSLLTTIGIFGTFTGIVIGLLSFDHTNIDGSISDLLEGLKTAFVTSLFGILASVSFKLLQSLGALRINNITIDEPIDVSPVDILNAINQQGESIDRLVNTIGEYNWWRTR